MIQVQEVEHVNTEDLVNDLEKIGIHVTGLQVDIGSDRMTNVVIKGNFRKPIDYGISYISTKDTK